MIPVHHIAATQMFFLLEGMNDAARREGAPPIQAHSTKGNFYKRIADETQGGVIDFVVELAPIIDTLTACVLVALESCTMDFHGVFEYEVTAAVGDLLYRGCYTQLPMSQDYTAIRLMAAERAHDFFMEGEDNPEDFTRYLTAVNEIERQLSDGTYQFRGARR